MVRGILARLMILSRGLSENAPAAVKKEADDIGAILQKLEPGPGGLIAVLEAIQSAAGYLPEKAIRRVSEKTGRSMVDLYGLATFYRSFSLKPRGRYTISVCQGTACHVRGAPMLVDEFQRQLGVMPGETTTDGTFTLETVNCLGACALGPIVVGGDQYYSKVETLKVKEILKKVRSETHTADIKNDPRFFPVAVRCSLCERSLMDPDHLIDGHPSVQLAAAYEGRQGTVRFSSLYGSSAVECDLDIPNDAVTDFSCPHCSGPLRGEASCPECDSPMAPMLVEGGGLVEICTKRNCKGHTLDLTLDYF
jgi:NADH-quinone oxidoreductase subunit E